MPLTNLNPNNTERWFLDYTVGGIQHSLLMRTAIPYTDANASTAIGGLLTAAGTLIQQITIVGLRKAVQGSNVTNAATWSGNATYGTGAIPNNNRARFISWVGRDTLGYRVRATLFGAAGTLDDNYRMTNVESSLVAAVNTYLAGRTNDWVTLAFNHPTWKSYANVGYNAYWTRQIRTGS
jgi:hypothetical protein